VFEQVADDNSDAGSQKQDREDQEDDNDLLSMTF